MGWGERAVMSKPTGCNPWTLGKDVVDNVTMHVGQPEVPAAVTVRQPLVIQPHQVQHGRVQVVDVDAVLDRLEAEFVGRAVRQPALHAAAGEAAKVARSVP